MKFPFVSKRGRSWRVAAVALGVALFLPGALMAQGGRSTVVTMSPSGSSSLSWKRPSVDRQDAQQAGENNLQLTLLAIPDEAAAAAPAVKPIALTQPETLQYRGSDEAGGESRSPIRPVRLIQQAEQPEPAAQPKEFEYSSIDEAYRAYGVDQPAPAAAQPNQANNNPMLQDDPFVDECPDPKKLTSILDISYKVTPQPGLFPESCPLPDETYYRKAPTPITFTWKASCLCHKPLYFEDVQLERYGHSRCPVLQPVISGVRFWATIPILPYLMGVYPPNECIYDLGYFRPGSCAPHMLQPLPISLRGALIEAGVVVGLAAAIP